MLTLPLTKKKKTLANLLISKGFISLVVIPLGFEPRTHTLKVYCSTNWATESCPLFLGVQKYGKIVLYQIFKKIIDGNAELIKPKEIPEDLFELILKCKRKLIFEWFCVYFKLFIFCFIFIVTSFEKDSRPKFDYVISILSKYV